MLPQSQNAPGAFEGVIAPSGLKKYDWQTDIVFFSDSFNGLPGLAVAGRKGKNGWLLLYSNSRLPDLRKKAVFMRSEGVPVKSITTNILVVPTGSTIAYTQDLLDEFSTRAQFFELFYYRQVYESDFLRAALLAGLPLAWHNYSAVATLDDNSRFSESGRAFGAGLAPGLIISASDSRLNKGFAGSLFLLYNKLWFKSSDAKLAGGLRKRLNGFRFGFSVGWRFNFYR